MDNRIADITLNKDEMKLWSSLALKGIDNAMTGLANAWSCPPPATAGGPA